MLSTLTKALPDYYFEELKERAETSFLRSHKVKLAAPLVNIVSTILEKKPQNVRFNFLKIYTNNF